MSTPHRTATNAKTLMQDVEKRYDLAFGQEGALGVLKALKNEDPESLDSVKAILTSRKPFSSVEYPVVAEFFKLSGTAADPFHGWEKLVVPGVRLPMSELEPLTLRTMQAFVYRRGIEAEAGQFLGGSFPLLVGLFGRILYNRLEIGSGGRAEREIFCGDQMVLLVRELNYKLRSEPQKFLKALAKVICELFAVWHLNAKAFADVDLANPTYACLSDAADTYFLSYDGKVLRHKYFKSTPSTQEIGLNDAAIMYGEAKIAVDNFLFGILIRGFSNAMNLNRCRSIQRGEIGPHWKKACELVYKANAYLERAHEVNSDSPAKKGWGFFNERYFPSDDFYPAQTSSSFRDIQSGEITLMLPATIDAIAQSIQDARKLKTDPDPNWEPDVLTLIRTELVESFWSRMPAAFRKLFEHTVLFKGESFETLACAAKHPEEYAPTFRKYAPEVIVEVFVRYLKESEEVGHWNAGLDGEAQEPPRKRKRPL
ncbi:hypothetical protein C8R46DRAFT_1091641 [Mycena filopes]|nr:hypothetical protein C8R46DRAFT_1091641 [Mycena filopes]